MMTESELLDLAWSYPLFEALYGRRSRRFGLGFEMPEGPFSTNLLWDRAIAAGRCFGAVHQGLWFDIGRPENIGMTEAFLEAA